jgi:DNA-binding Lrp family transcriptional regulator
MVTVFVLINSKTGKENQVFERMKEIPQVIEAYPLYGVYDIIAIIKAETMQELKDIIARRVRRIADIDSTLTMVVI